MVITNFLLALVIIAGLFVADPVVEYDIVVGEIATETIAATRDIEDEYTTRQRIQEARDAIQNIYKTDLAICDSVTESTVEIIEAFATVRSAAQEFLENWIREQVAAIPEPVAPPEEDGVPVGPNQFVVEDPAELQAQRVTYENLVAETRATTVQGLLDREAFTDAFWSSAAERVDNVIGKGSMRAALQMTENDLVVLQDRVPEMVLQQMNAGVREERLEEEKEALLERFRSLGVSEAAVSVLGRTVVERIEVNVFFDEEATLAAKDAAEAAVEHILYKKGQTIIQSGQPITQWQYEMVSALGLLKSGAGDYSNYISMALVILLVCFVQMFVVHSYLRNVFSEIKGGVIFALVVAAAALSYLIVKEANVYICTSLFAVILLSLLMDNKIGLIAGVSLSLILGIYNGGDFSVAIISAVACSFCAASVRHATQRRGTVILVGLASGVAAFAMATLMNYYFTAKLDGIWNNAAWIIGGSFLVAVIAVGVLPVMEYLFKIITPIRLLELSNPNQPILKKLLTEAPGTYHHSIIVGNLAETAANTVGANGVLARIGAYYHDIGKLSRPYMFKENQHDDANPHDELPPEISAKIIISHVKDGLQLAKEYKVPEILHQFIEEHHGSTLASFFYFNACELYGKENVNEEDYRYSGKIPSTKECAIVMLADTVEAAVRSMKSHDPVEVRNMITKLVDAKIDGHQLDNCPLTLKEISVIKESFLTVLSGAYHERVAYPQFNGGNGAKEKGE